MAPKKKALTKTIRVAKRLPMEASISGLEGKAVFIRCVTHYYTGRLAYVGRDQLVLDDAAWVADTGRFATALGTGALSEVEPYPGRVYIMLGSVVDVSEWKHPLPRETK